MDGDGGGVAGFGAAFFLVDGRYRRRLERGIMHKRETFNSSLQEYNGTGTRSIKPIEHPRTWCVKVSESATLPLHPHRSSSSRIGSGCARNVGALGGVRYCII